ncbi:MAG: (d)CMP kinase [Frankiaceae bacterium]
MNEPAAFDRRVLDRLVVAIDGPSGSGKSTVARGVATRLDLRYLDTGAMYRALTWLAQRDGVAAGDDEALAKLASCWRFEISTDPVRPRVIADDVEVTTAIRSSEVTAEVSAVSAVPAVRAALVARQRDIVGAGGIVMEGRDTGTVVCPEAPVKIYLTASGGARALRRATEERDRHRLVGDDVIALTQAELDRRDQLDSSRDASPLRKAEGALEVDTTALSADEVIDVVVAACRSVAASTAPSPPR